MPARLTIRLALLALLLLPATVGAANYWPSSAYPSNQFGWNIANMPTALDAVADGAGGYFAAWDDGYGGHVQHVLANGSTAWPWYVYGLPGSSLGYLNPAIVLDGSGGVLVAFETHGGGDDLRLQRVAANGAPAPGWPAGGVAVCPSTDYDYLADVAADAYGGAFVSFVRTGPNAVFVQHVLSTGAPDPSWPANGVQVQEKGMTYSRPRVLSDGEGGAMVLYHGSDPGWSRLFASRVDRNGVKRTDLFPGNGLVLGEGVYNANYDVVRTPDGLFGAVWTDGNEIRIDVLDGYGRTGAAPPGGLPLTDSPATNDVWPTITTNRYSDFLVTWVAGSKLMGARRQQDLSLHPEFPTGAAVLANPVHPSTRALSIDSDDAGGMFVGWHDPAIADVVRAQHLTRYGTVAAGWGAAGDTLARNPSGVGDQLAIFSDGDGGASGVFRDYNMLGTNRIRRDGSHGLYAPALITAANDVPMDQGGKLSLYWRASERDTAPANPVGSYAVWRRMPAIAAQARLARGSRVLATGESPDAAGPGVIRAVPAAATTEYWEYLGGTPARGWPGYGMTVATLADQYAPTSYVEWEVFLVETLSPAGVVLATSQPDSGFSIDNLSPAPPAAFTGVRSGGATHLSWQPNGEADLLGYRLHRGTDASFVPSDANLVAELTGTSYADAAAAGFFYKLSAADVHGNRSGFALVTPAQTLDAPLAAPTELSFAPIAPNPACGRVALSFALPTASDVRLAVYDAQGRLVHTLVDGARSAGRHDVAWDLRDRDGQALAPGLYLARLSTAAGTVVRRLAVIG